MYLFNAEPNEKKSMQAIFFKNWPFVGYSSSLTFFLNQNFSFYNRGFRNISNLIVKTWFDRGFLPKVCRNMAHLCSFKIWIIKSNPRWREREKERLGERKLIASSGGKCAYVHNLFFLTWPQMDWPTSVVIISFVFKGKV